MNPNKSNLLIAAVLVVIAASLKALTHPHSIDPIIAISLFSGVIIKDRKLAFALPLLGMFFSDVILEVFQIAPGFYGMSQIGNYISLVFVTLLGFGMRRISLLNVALFSIGSSLIFFFLSNTNCFLFDTTNYYGAGLIGCGKCLAAGLPFVRNGLAIDLFFSTILFGSYQLLLKKQLIVVTQK